MGPARCLAGSTGREGKHRGINKRGRGSLQTDGCLGNASEYVSVGENGSSGLAKIVGRKKNRGVENLLFCAFAKITDLLFFIFVVVFVVLSHPSCCRLLNKFPNLQIHTRCRDSVCELPILINEEGLGSLWWQNGQDRLGVKFGRKAVCRIAFRCARQRRFRPMGVSGWSWFVSRTIENRHTGKALGLTFEFQFRDRLPRLSFENQIEI